MFSVKTEPADIIRQVPSLENGQVSSPQQTVITSSASLSSSTVHLLNHPSLKTVPAGNALGKNTLPSSTSVSTATKSALLERITSSGNQITSGNLLLAGHLTGAIPITGNSGLVPTTSAVIGNQSMNIITKNQSNLQNQSVVVSEPQTLYLTQRHQTIAPEQWHVMDVCHFLKYNDCSAYVEIFHRKVRNDS